MSERPLTGEQCCAGDAAAYALGALEPAEAEAFRGHLERCAVCRDEAEALIGVVQALPMAAPQYPAPRRVRRRVLGAIRREASPTAARRRWTPAPVRPRGLVAVLGATALVAAVIIAGFPGAGGNPGQRVIPARVAESSASAELRVNQGRGELIIRRLPPPPPGHIYEVWLRMAHSAPTPTKLLFSVTSNGSADVPLPGGLQGISQVLVTPEPAGGSQVPTHRPVIVAQLS